MVKRNGANGILLDTEHQLQEKKSFITIIIIAFYDIFIKLRSIFNLLKTIYMQL